MNDSGTGFQRLFFALWPDDLCRERLAREARKLHKIFAGRITQHQSIHMTLVFLGDVPSGRIDEVHTVAAETLMQSFSLRMAGGGCWMHNHIGWLAPAQTPAPLTQLVSDLRRALCDIGFAIERRPFAPHVTLLRKAQCRPVEPRIDPFEWQVQDFVLVQSQPAVEGSQYQVLERWSAK
jgi:2'-5' RNA ligase